MSALGRGVVLPAGRMFRPGGAYSAPARRVVVYARRPSPTADIYLAPRLRPCPLPVAWVDVDAPGTVDLDGAFVIVVRYLSGAAARRLVGAADRLAGVAYLMDDDIPRAPADASLPLDYRLGLMWFWRRFSSALARLSSEVWLASDALAETHGAGDGVWHRIDPAYVGPALPRPDPPAGAPVRIAYHASRTHEAEALWLRDVIAELASRLPGAEFEVICGGDRIARAYRGIPGVRVRRGMPWPNYLEHAARTRADILLAPLLETAFNRARSYAKFLDALRLGAVGVFADAPPYRAVVERTGSGLLLPPDPGRWADAVAELAQDAQWRRRLRPNCPPPDPALPPALRRLCGGCE